MCFPSFAKDRIDYIANDGKCWSTFIYIFFETSLRFQCKLHFVGKQRHYYTWTEKKSLLLDVYNIWIGYGTNTLQSKFVKKITRQMIKNIFRIVNCTLSPFILKYIKMNTCKQWNELWWEILWNRIYQFKKQINGIKIIFTSEKMFLTAEFKASIYHHFKYLCAIISNSKHTKIFFHLQHIPTNSCGRRECYK